MSIGFEYNETENILFIRSGETLCMQDYLVYRNALRNQPFRDNLRCLANYLGTTVSMNYEEMLYTVKRTRDIFEGTKRVRVVICVTGALSLGLARMYSLLNESDDYQVQVVDSVEEALRTLNIDPELLPEHFEMLNAGAPDGE